MKTDLIERIQQYLKIETDYAVLINGDYGIGKTYFFKNSLTPEIKNMTIPGDNNKKYIPIHISLFGIKSIEDIQSQIFLSIHPILKNKRVKLASGIAKSIMRGMVQMTNLGNIDDYLGDINVTAAEDWLNFNELVLCFDDFDRKSDDLNLGDLFGYINTLVENEGAKIIIIANVKSLDSEKKYITELREKVIGITIEFKPDLDTIYDLIITEYSNTDTAYFEFLVKNKELITEGIEKNKNNLRHLNYFLRQFKTILCSLLNEFDTEKEFNYLKEEKIKTVLDFSLPVLIEYKIGAINSSNFKDIKELSNFNFIDLNLMSNSRPFDNQEKRELSYSDKFKAKYFKKNKFHYLDSVFNYIIGLSAFSIQNLKKELIEIFPIIDDDKSKTQEILDQLEYFDFLKYNDKEYRELTNELLKQVDNGKLLLEDYITAFHYATRLNNVLRFNIEKLLKRFKTGIKKGKYKYIYRLHFRFSYDENTEYKDELSTLQKYCVEINNNIQKQEEKIKLTRLLDLFGTNHETFIEFVKEADNQYKYSSFWAKFPINKVYQIINKLNKNQIIDLGFYFRERYRGQIDKDLYVEKEFLKSLKEKINKPKKRKVRNLRNETLNILTKKIEESINNFPSH